MTSGRIVVFAGVVGLVVAMAAGWLVPRSSAAFDPAVLDQQLYFNETGQLVSGPFMAAWDDLGGLDQTGFPVSPPVKYGNRWIQWFEFARLEIINVELDQAIPADVRLAPIGNIYANRMGYPKTNQAFATVPQSDDGSRYFPETGHSLINGFLLTYENDENEARLGRPISQEFSENGNVYQYFEYGALSWNEADDETQFVTLGTLDAILQGVTHQRLDKPEGVDVYEPPEPEVSEITGAAYAGERWIDINLSNYTITAFEGEVPVLSSLIVVGAAVSPTVTGQFNVYWKLDAQDMAGVGYDGTPYQQDDVPWVMYFYQDFAIHGAYWRNGFGYAASHGCVNVPTDQAAILYSWASVGTRVNVHY